MIFRKKKYYFNTVTLTFEEVKSTKVRRVFSILSYVVMFLAIAVISGYFLNRVFGSQESRILEKQVAVLKHDMRFLYDKGYKISAFLQKDLFVKDNNYRTILQMDTLSLSLRQAGTGGSAASYGTDIQSNLVYQVENIINRLNNQLKVQSGSFNALYEKAKEYSAEQTHLPAIIPIAQEDLIMISSDFGLRSDPFFFMERVHCGLDFVAQEGKAVHATGEGTVTFLQYSRTGYGNEIVIDHTYGFGSRYAHLETVKVKEGERVKRGQMIGTVGETGRATGPHLHYEVLYERRPVNPSFYLIPV